MTGTRPQTPRRCCRRPWRRFSAASRAGLELQVHEGGAAKVLIDASVGAVVLVVGSRGHGGFAGLLLGSVSANVAEHAPCPVLIIHGDQPPPR